MLFDFDLGVEADIVLTVSIYLAILSGCCFSDDRSLAGFGFCDWRGKPKIVSVGLYIPEIMGEI